MAGSYSQTSPLGGTHRSSVTVGIAMPGRRKRSWKRFVEVVRVGEEVPTRGGFDEEGELGVRLVVLGDCHHGRPACGGDSTILDYAVACSSVIPAGKLPIYADTSWRWT